MSLFSLNSAVRISYFVLFLFAAMLFSNPLYLTVFFLAALIGISLNRALRGYGGVLSVFLSMGALLVLINLFLSQSGESVLFESQALAGFYRIVVTKESIVYSLVMAFKLCLVATIIYWYDAAVGPDCSFSFFSRFIPRSALLVILTALIVSQLRKRLEEAAFAMRMRGADLGGTGIFRRLQSSAPLIKVLLISSLEDSLSRAEALYARAYGSGVRTRYLIERWRFVDWIGLSGLALMLCLCLHACISLGAFSVFYPQTVINITRQDVLCSALLGILCLFPALTDNRQQGVLSCSIA